MGLKITSTEPGVRKALEEYNRRHDGVQNTERDGPIPIYRAYSPEAFVDAIVEWVVADDQVLCLHVVLLSEYLPNMIFSP